MVYNYGGVFMKGYCEWCSCEIDEVEFIQFEMHELCKKELDTKVIQQIKYPKLKIKKGNEVFHYVCQSATWNYWLNRFYPIAELTLITETINPN